MKAAMQAGKPKTDFMQEALRLARQAAELGEVPVGAVIARPRRSAKRQANACLARGARAFCEKSGGGKIVARNSR